MRSLLGILVVVCLCSVPLLADKPPAKVADKPAPLPQCAMGSESGLPLPSTYSTNNDPAAYQAVLAGFLTSYKYEGWCHDKRVRDTGPFVAGKYYGTHPAVRIWYSPAVARWVLGGRKGAIPDGAMIIKEQFDTPPAGQYEGWTQVQLHQYFNDHYDWTVMVKDAKGAADGWYWAEIFKNITPDSYAPPFAVFNTGFGLYCLRCHGSAEKELTFSSSTNIAGQPGEPLQFRDDESWFPNRLTPPVPPPPSLTPAAKAAQLPVPAASVTPSSDAEEATEAETHPLVPLKIPPTHPHVSPANMPRLAVAHRSLSNDWKDFFRSAGVSPRANPLPGENYDHVVAPQGNPRLYLTSDQCFGCHSGNSYGNVMLATDDRLLSQPLVNVGPYGEWRWSPMGLAGRDPIFYAQLDSERAYLSRHQSKNMLENITDICFSCHGGMGERQLKEDTASSEDQKAKVKAIEKAHGQGLNAPDPHPFEPSIVQLRDLGNPQFRYGALARDGISCAMCHHIKDTTDKSVMQFIEEDARGQFQTTPAGELEGPFNDPAVIPMHNSLGIKPVHDDYTKNARICGTCHTIPLPVVDFDEGKKPDGCDNKSTSFEQATYLEWLNSAYQNEIDPGRSPNARTCQDCHMKGTLNGTQIETKIAAVQDVKYPAADHMSPVEIPVRATGYARHQLQGLNVFLLGMFDQFNEQLGVRKCDYMTGGCSGVEPTSGIPFATRNFVQDMARETATVAVSKTDVKGGTLTADVTVTNLTGHRFPSGVSFRRAFIDFIVSDPDSGEVYFESGRTNSIGAIVDMSGNVLPSEYNGSSGANGHAFQPHFWSGKPITRSDQVQIYEELLKNADNEFTTSFIRQDCHFKDNRILPLGWSRNGPDLKQFNGVPLEETWADLTGDDPYYNEKAGGLGQSLVRYSVPLPPKAQGKTLSVSAQLYYQAAPPYYLLQRFEQAPEGEGTQRLYFITSTLDASKTPFPGWKLLVTQSGTTYSP
jgi:hypothetical protein